MAVTLSGLARTIRKNVRDALAEDLGSGDVTAALLPPETAARANIIAREDLTLAGRPWVDEVYRQLDRAVRIDWYAADGERVMAGATLCRLEGPARPLLSGERTAINFLQLLSGTATVTSQYVSRVAGTRTRILDTRKTLPGLRLAQKYAVRCGGGTNHRLGLYDAILVKENHILSAGGIAAAVERARAAHPGLPVEIEVESEAELREALAAGADRVLLDNFPLAGMRRAVAVNDEMGRPAELEASGGLTLDEIAEVAATGVDYISVGALTKHVRAIDLSMRVEL